MAQDKNRTAYIGIERGEKSVKYMAKVFNESPREITRQQYNSIVKTMGAQDWSNTDEDESSIINSIIVSHLDSTEKS